MIDDNPITEGVTQKASAIFHTIKYMESSAGMDIIIEALLSERKQAMREALELPEVKAMVEVLNRYAYRSNAVTKCLHDFQSLRERL